MPARQFRLRTLLLAITVLCLHFAVAAWSTDVFLWVIPCSTFAITAAAARRQFGATVGKSIAWGVAAGTGATAIAFGSFGVAQVLVATRGFVWIPMGAMVGAVFGFIVSLGAGCVYAGISLLQGWIRNRPDLYYVEPDGESAGNSERRSRDSMNRRREPAYALTLRVSVKSRYADGRRKKR